MKFLLIDTFNLFIRSFTSISSLNENGEHVGGVSGSILSLYYTIKRLEPDFVFLCYEGRNSGARRRKSFHNYKDGSKSPHTITKIESVNSENTFWSELFLFQQLVSLLPVCPISIDNLEADDVISFIINAFPKDEKIIVSTDKDYYQLIDDNTKVYDPKNKVLIDTPYIKEKYKILPINWLIVKCFLGDKSDNIKKIKGLGIKRINKFLPELIDREFRDLNSFLQYVKEKNDDKIFHYINDDILEDLKSNYKLMDLQNLNLSITSSEAIKNTLGSWKSEMDLINFRLLLQKNFINLEVSISSMTLIFRRLDYESKNFNEYVRQIWTGLPRLNNQSSS